MSHRLETTKNLILKLTFFFSILNSESIICYQGDRWVNLKKTLHNYLLNRREDQL